MLNNQGRYLLILLLFTFCNIEAQVAPSPFSSIGVGRLGGMGVVQNKGIGNVGIGMGSYWNLNLINPALLVYSRGTLFNQLTVFQAGMLFEANQINNQTTSEKSRGAGMNYLVMGMPVIRDRWFASFGLRPYSSVNYNLNYTYEVAGADSVAHIREVGSEGINMVHISNGVALSKNFSLGIETDFLFSSIKNDFTNYVIASDSLPVYASSVFQRTAIKGLLLKGGIAYQDSIRIGKKEPLKITIGATYDVERMIKGTRFESLERRSFEGAIYELDTLLDNEQGTYTIPAAIGFGLSLGQGSKWTIGMDVKSSQWTRFVNFGESPPMRDALFVALGGELTPNAFSVEDYYQRITYRMGFHYEMTPYLVNNFQVSDFGINFGLSLPIVPSASGSNTGVGKGFSSVDFAFSYGKLGNAGNNLIEEQYFKIHFGVTFNDRWFIRNKFN
ncbi:MAG: outer membrane protein transport protein [Cyclobacteriaceae bacterium]|nr:outer membrane protein transport protein [Cyclobacteriaceae bacterium]